MALAYIADDWYPYIAFFDNQGNRFAHKQIVNNQTFAYTRTCKINEDSIMIMMSDLTSGLFGAHRKPFYTIINKNRKIHLKYKI